MEPLVFIGGASGSGKSTLAASLAAAMDLLFLEVDLWGRDGIDFHNLRREWDDFWERHDATSLAATLRARSKLENLAGVVASFPSNAVFTVARIRAARDAGILPIVTHGSEAACLNAFVTREKQNGRRLDATHWHTFSSDAHRTYSRPEYVGVRVASFESDGKRRSLSAIVAEVRQNLKAG